MQSKRQRLPAHWRGLLAMWAVLAWVGGCGSAGHGSATITDANGLGAADALADTDADASLDADLSSEEVDTAGDLLAPPSDGPPSVEVANDGLAAADVDGSLADGGDAGPACQSAADCKPTPCQDALCISAVCQYGLKADGAPCPALDLCAGGGQCQAGMCQAKGQKPCDDNNLCTADACDAKTGACVHEAKTTEACDDGNPCTKGDACAFDGKCLGGNNICTGCTSLKDCAAYDDSNPCNGTLFCNTGKSPGVCEILPSTVVVCDSSGDTACGHTACNPSTGLCKLAASPDGTACDDGNPCTQGDLCSGGTCTFKADVCQCQSDGDCAAWDDKNACNGKLFCDVGSFPHVCKPNPATVVACPGVAEPCQALACDPASGKCSSQPVPNGTACTDGNLNTTGDSCQSGKCASGVDTALCKTDLDCLAQEDGDLCNGTLFCNKVTGKCQLNPKTVVSCPSADDTVCKKNLCQKKTGVCQLVPVAEGQGCDDGNVCTQGEVCQKGDCVASADTCACKADADCKTQEDGDLCNGTLYCDKQQGKCVVNPATIVSCSATFDTPCSKNLCDKKVGKCAMTPVAEGHKCDDGNGCTAGEVCTVGSCVASADTCACKADSDCKSFEDGNLCNGTLYCNKASGQCAINPATLVACPTVKDTACSKTQCNAVSGACEATAVNEGGQCDADGNPCTTSDWCSGGTCKPGAMTCNCQLNSDCEGKQGDDKCVGTMYCDLNLHECKPAQVKECTNSQDGPCLVTACDKATGQCQQKPRADGTVCEENTLCTGAQICQAGSCVTGKAVNCDDVNPCTADACEAKQGGCLHAPLDA
ncbi:MAG: hypothetical protein HY902_21375, partial [Deltaproteobacteria bacterium]|nr:hypothetical protein [Deltaproteobacteria bacterium]